MRPGTLTAGWLIALLLCVGTPGASAQTFSFSTPETLLSDTVGAELVFDATCTNLSAATLTLMFVRTLNDLPDQWQSSMCLDVCYQSTQDTVLTTPEYGSSPLAPGEVRSFSLHLYAQTNPGSGYVRILVMDSRNPGDSSGVLFTGSATTSGVDLSSGIPDQFALEQNYPNPFNPVTSIMFAIPDNDSRVGTLHATSLQVFDLLGRRVATLVNDNRGPGMYTVRFAADGLASGTYFYRLTADGVTRTRRMLLLR